MMLSDEQKNFFIREGYVILPGFVDDYYIATALDFLKKRVAAGEHGLKDKTRGKTDPSIKFGKPAKRAPPIIDLVFKTGLLELAEDLLGEGNATVRDNLGQIAYNEPRKDLIERGTHINAAPSKHRWHIDAGHGKYAALGSDFSVLIGVALTDGQQVDENRGQFTMFPKSHLVTHPALAEIIKKNPSGNATDDFIDKGVANIGNPMRACLAPGDAFVAHQRVAHCPGINLWEKPRINIYFRIVHALIDDILDDQILSPTPWVGFDGLRHLLPAGAVDYTDHSLSTKVAERKLPKFAKNMHVSHPRELAQHELILTEEQKQAFISDGYIVISTAVSSELVRIALKYTDQAFEDDKYNLNGSNKLGSKDPFPTFHQPVMRSEELLGLFFKSGLYGVAEQILGENNIALRDELGQVLYNTPSETFIQEGKVANLPHPKQKWGLDMARGSHKPYATDFMFRVGVCLSEGQHVEEPRGQFIVWPGSHVLTHPVLGEAIESAPTGEAMRLFRSKKLDVGNPKRILMQPGDALISHQRLATAPGINLSDTVGKNVVFRVTHVHLDELLDTYLKSPTPWTGFSGLQSLLSQDAIRWNVQTGKKMNAMRRLLDASSVGKSRSSLMLSKDMLATFVRDGYVVIPGAVPLDLIGEALDFLDSAFEGKQFQYIGKTLLGSDFQAPEFRRMVKRSSQVKNMFYQSGLLDVCEQLLGHGNVMVRNGMAEVSYISQSELFVKEGMAMNKAYPPGKWQVLNQKAINQHQGAGDYSFMVGVAISEGQEVDENRGQLVVWPGSHIKSHQALAQLVHEGDSIENLNKAFRKQHLKLGKPVRVLLKPGDAVITHQRLALAQGINLSPSVRKNVYFPVHNDSFDSSVAKFVSSTLPFYGFEGVQDIVAQVFQQELDKSQKIIA